MEDGSPAAAEEILPPTDPIILNQIESLVRRTGVDTGTLEGQLVTQMMATALRLVPDGRHTGELKLINGSLRELRYAFKVFAQYRSVPKISIFGSARTPEDHADYAAARDFACLMAKTGWMIITGAGNGIMKAGHEGPGREACFGVSIRLPFETNANAIIAGDDKLINFRYFFTRKVTFVSQSDAVALLPGGFGTQDENFETLTLIQTGKAQMVPVVMLEGGERGAKTEGGYWMEWDRWVRGQLMKSGWICPADTNLYYLAESPEDAAAHVRQFYRVYHSARYVREQYVIRLRQRISDELVERLNDEYADLIETGRITLRDKPLDEERDYPDLPRLVFHHTRRDWGRVRRLIDEINEDEAEGRRHEA